MVPEKDKVSVIYGVNFVNAQDVAIGHVIFSVSYELNSGINRVNSIGQECTINLTVS